MVNHNTPSISTEPKLDLSHSSDPFIRLSLCRADALLAGAVPAPDVPAVFRRAGDQPGRGLRLLRRPPVASPRPHGVRGGARRGLLDVLRGPVDPPPRGRGAHGPRLPPRPRRPLRRPPGDPRRYRRPARGDGVPG